MAGTNGTNGKRPTGLLHILHPALGAAKHPDPDSLPFDLEAALSAVVALEATIPEHAHTASMLGTEREGNAVLIAPDGLFLTIGYLIAEAESVRVAATPGRMCEAMVVAYDYDTGFGLVRSAEPPGMAPLPLGSSASVSERDTVIVAPHGGLPVTISAVVVSKREFAGYWEYMLDYGLFTSPAHPHWNGAALIDGSGALVGIGSLYVEDALAENRSLPGNMFVPIDFLKPIQDELVANGRRLARSRPWIGIYVAAAMGRVFVSGTSPRGPAAAAGLTQGDIVLALDGQPVNTVADLYRTLWAAGPAGVEISLRILRDSDVIEMPIVTTSREHGFTGTARH